MTSVSAGHIILTPTQPVSSLRPEQGSNLIPSGEKSGAVPTELLKVCNMGGWSTAFVDPTSFLIVLSDPVSQSLNHPLALVWDSGGIVFVPVRYSYLSCLLNPK